LCRGWAMQATGRLARLAGRERGSCEKQKNEKKICTVFKLPSRCGSGPRVRPRRQRPAPHAAGQGGGRRHRWPGTGRPPMPPETRCGVWERERGRGWVKRGVCVLCEEWMDGKREKKRQASPSPSPASRVRVAASGGAAASLNPWNHATCTGPPCPPGAGGGRCAGLPWRPALRPRELEPCQRRAGRGSGGPTAAPAPG
jgi:hypothetical protein